MQTYLVSDVVMSCETLMLDNHPQGWTWGLGWCVASDMPLAATHKAWHAFHTQQQATLPQPSLQ